MSDKENNNKKDLKPPVVKSQKSYSFNFKRPSWDFIRNNVYVEKNLHRLPKFLIAGCSILLVIVLVFALAPRLIERSSWRAQASHSQQKQWTPKLDQVDLVVRADTAPIYQEPDIKSLRYTTALLNEPLTLLEEQPINGFFKICLTDQSQGYIKQLDVSQDLSSLTGDDVVKQVMVLGRRKRLMSHTRNGSLLGYAPMGTYLLADYASNELVRVKLPDGQRAWLNTEDLVLADPGEAFQLTDKETSPTQLFLSSAMAFAGASYLPGGLEYDATDLPGLVHIAGKVNGLALARNLPALSDAGSGVTFDVDQDNMPSLAGLQPGDLLFFAASPSEKDLSTMAVLMTNDRILVHLPNSSSLSLYKWQNDKKMLKSLRKVRRLFD